MQAPTSSAMADEQTTMVDESAAGVISTNSIGDDRDDKHHKSHKKSKKQKKEKKKKSHRRHDSDDDNDSDHDTHDRKRTRKDSSTDDEEDEHGVPKSTEESIVVDVAVVPVPIPKPPSVSITTAVSKSNFFAQLAAEESKKPPVGTVHAGKKDALTEAATAAVKTQDWTCWKCSTVNGKYDAHCKKCKSMKRLGTGYR